MSLCSVHLQREVTLARSTVIDDPAHPVNFCYLSLPFGPYRKHVTTSEGQKEDQLANQALRCASLLFFQFSAHSTVANVPNWQSFYKTFLALL